MTIQELINELETIEDKNQEIYILAYPEWDNCSFNIPIYKEDISKNYYDLKLGKNITYINAECQTEDVDGEDID